MNYRHPCSLCGQPPGCVDRIAVLEKLLKEAILHLDPSNCTNREERCDAMADNDKLIKKIKSAVR